jgi:prepilin-type processing-associated H-X9-DG protein
MFRASLLVATSLLQAGCSDRLFGRPGMQSDRGGGRNRGGCGHWWPGFCGQPRGVTVIEIVLVISVIVVLIAILLPAVVNVRNASRQMNCMSRMRQIGVAIQQFVSSHQALPPISAAYKGNLSASRDAASVHVELLAHLDQAALSRQVFAIRPLSSAIYPPEISTRRSRELLTTPIDVFRCPSDDGVGLNNFVFCQGSEAVAKSAIDGSPFWGNGPFPLVGALPLSHVTDGLANTAAVSERLTGLQDETTFAARRDFWYSAADLLFPIPNVVSRGELISICDSANVVPSQAYQYGGWTWATNRYNSTSYNHCVPPNSQHIDCSTMQKPPLGRISSLSGIFKATSNHPGGVNQLFLDGSVSFVADSIDIEVYRAFGTRNGAELAGR